LHLPGEQVGERRPLAAIRHVQRGDAGHHLEQLAEYMGGSPYAARYSITSSASASSLSGTVRPSILAVWWLITSSIFDTCITGKSAGRAPLRMRPT
jgi:hypothetical protein